MKTNATLTLLCLLSFFSVRAQNFLYNGDFELYSGCPYLLDMVDSCLGWYSAIRTPDYYNCTFLSDINNYPQEIIGASSGTGFMGFADYGDANGSGEAIGQTLSSPLVPGTTYYLSVAAKRPYYGAWISDCAGVALYGFKDAYPLDSEAIHISDLAGSMMLGVTDTVDNSQWETFDLSFVPVDTIHYVVFTTENAPSCPVYVMIDAAVVSDNEVSAPLPSSSAGVPVISPNPCSGNFTVEFPSARNGFMIELFDLAGRMIYAAESNDPSVSVNVTDAASGLYLLKVRTADGYISSLPVQIVK